MKLGKKNGFLFELCNIYADLTANKIKLTCPYFIITSIMYKNIHSIFISQLKIIFHIIFIYYVSSKRL